MVYDTVVPEARNGAAKVADALWTQQPESRTESRDIVALLTQTLQRASTIHCLEHVLASGRDLGEQDNAQIGIASSLWSFQICSNGN